MRGAIAGPVVSLNPLPSFTMHYNCRTVFITDDGTNKPLTIFVADKVDWILRHSGPPHVGQGWDKDGIAASSWLL